MLCRQVGGGRFGKWMGACWFWRAPKIMGARPHKMGGLVISSFSSLQLRVDDFLRSARGDTLPRSALSCSAFPRLDGSSRSEGGIVHVCSVPGESRRLRAIAREAVCHPPQGCCRQASCGLVSKVDGGGGILPSCVSSQPHRIPLGRESNRSGVPDAHLVAVSSLGTLAVSCPIILFVIFDGREGRL